LKISQTDCGVAALILHLAAVEAHGRIVAK
jgi:hypothetical protein